jgi:S-formylglutathione hydrolase FrmB
VNVRAGVIAALVLAGCSKPAPEYVDRPRLLGKVVLRDVTFHSKALARDMRYRVVLPATGQPSRVVYLLHGGGGEFRDWTNYTDVSRFAERGLLLIMPQGDYSYYVNAAEPPQNRYEDYIVQDLVGDVESRFGAGRPRAIAGVSMGGFGAIKLALSHPKLFAFVGALSPAVDAARRPFSVRRIAQSRALAAIFGPWDGVGRRGNDPFVLVREASAETPLLLIRCGDQEGLLGVNRQFAAVLKERGLPHEFEVVRGGHDWETWNGQLEGMFAALLNR